MVGGSAGRDSPFVDYERQAARYRRGRGLSSELLDHWGAAVVAHLPPSPRRVLDVGAGTGLFATVWASWLEGADRAAGRAAVERVVVAVEPSPAMVAEFDRSAPGVGVVRGRAEALPVAAASVDVIWVSTALHHFADLDAAVGEFARVLRPDGRVLVRTFLPGRSPPPFADQLPGREKWQRRFPGEEELAARFARHGLELRASDLVPEGTATFAESAEWVALMRDADSILTALDPEEVDEGLRRLRATPDRVAHLGLSLLVFGPRR